MAKTLTTALLATFLVASNQLNELPAKAFDPSQIAFNSGTCELGSAGYLGDGSQQSPYQISDSASLWETADCSVTSSRAAHFELVRDINVAGETLAPTSSPIGARSSIVDFEGSLNGNNHTISGLNISSAEFGVGLYMRLNNATFRNLTLEGIASQSSGVWDAAGGLARWSTGNLRLDGVTSSMDVFGDDLVGGLIGYAYGNMTVTNSANLGDVFATGDHAGGLAGWISATDVTYTNYISGFTNIGNITASAGAGGVFGSSFQVTSLFNSVHNYGDITTFGVGNTDAGGLQGYMAGSAQVWNSLNAGNITGAGVNTGGMFGFQETGNLRIVDSRNEGNVSGPGRVGGLAGTSQDISLSRVVNSGTISSIATGVNNNVGGFVGFATGAFDAVDSINSGEVSAPNTAGGMVGYSQNAAFFERATNTASIVGDTYVAGLLAFAGAGATFLNSHNSGQVSASNQFAGGLFGDVSGDLVVSGSNNSGTVSATSFVGGLGANVDGGGIFDTSFNTGVVTGGFFTGGLAGQVGASATASSSVNQATVLGSIATGGLFGVVHGHLSIRSSHNSATVSGEGLVGGLAGDSVTSEVVGSSNTGEVSGSSNWVGGLLGQSTDTAVFENAVNKGNVSGADDVGGLVGWAESLAVSSSFNSGNVAASMSDVPLRLESAGGFVGNVQAEMTVINSFNTGDISSRRASGGLVGFSYVDVVVTKSYNAGVPTTIAGGDADGMIGIASDSSLVTVDGFYTSQDSEYAPTSSLTQLRTSATFLGWNFSTLWGFGTCLENNGLPMLRYANEVTNYYTTGCHSVPAPASAGNSAPAVIPVFPEFDLPKLVGHSALTEVYTGTKLDLVVSAAILGLQVTISAITASHIKLTFPRLDPGVYTLVLETTNGSISYIDRIEIAEFQDLEPVSTVSKTLLLKITNLNPLSSWLTRGALEEISQFLEITDSPVITCLAYQARPGIIARTKAMSRAEHACRAAKSLGLETRTVVYNKAPAFGGMLKLIRH